MKDLALHILDIAQNSLRAESTLIQIDFEIDSASNTIVFTITDNGVGMSPAMLASVTDPYTTSRTTRRVGLGIPLLKQNAEQSGGSLHIESQQGRGTTLTATFQKDHIDTPPLGDLAGVIALLITGNPDANFIFRFQREGMLYEVDSSEIKEILDGVSIANPRVAMLVKEMVQSNLEDDRLF